MTARTCTECGATSANVTSDHCEACGAPLESRRLHENSDVRIESERLAAALPDEVSVPVGRWGRVSDHPHASDETMSSESERHAHPPPDAAAMAKPTKSVDATAAQVAGPTATHNDIAVVPVPRSDSGSHAALPIEARASSPNPSVPRRPPVLASEALLRDLAPSRPARSALRIWCPLLGALGIANAWFLTRGAGLGWPLTGAFVGLALLGLPPMPYAGRASAVATVAGTGLALVMWTDAHGQEGLSSIVLATAVTLLATGLLFRSWHRGSLLARIIVLAGVMLSSLFLWMSGDLSHLTVFDMVWQSWLPRLVSLAFAMLLLLSLLAFMDARSTAGATVWAGFILSWHALYTIVEVLHAAWPKYATRLETSRIPIDTLLAWTSGPLFTALLAIGLAQLLAAGLADSTARAQLSHVYRASHAEPFAPEPRPRPHAPGP
jgi:ribosomal protein L37E